MPNEWEPKSELVVNHFVRWLHMGKKGGSRHHNLNQVPRLNDRESRMASVALKEILLSGLGSCRLTKRELGPPSTEKIDLKSKFGE